NLITTPGLINLDFADVKSVMSGAGSALMGIGSSRGDGRAIEAAQKAINSPLLEASMDGAQGVLLSIAGGSDLGLFEINEAASLVQEAAHPEANIIFGTVIDDSLGDEVRVTVIAAGFEAGGPVHKKLEPVPVRSQGTPGQPQAQPPPAGAAAASPPAPPQAAEQVGRTAPVQAAAVQPPAQPIHDAPAAAVPAAPGGPAANGTRPGTVAPATLNPALGSEPPHTAVHAPQHPQARQERTPHQAGSLPPATPAEAPYTPPAPRLPVSDVFGEAAATPVFGHERPAPPRYTQLVDRLDADDDDVDVPPFMKR
ncbi:MAG: cell division protein FtsZ, partial [Pseudonocardia sp.]